MPVAHDSKICIHDLYDGQWLAIMFSRDYTAKPLLSSMMYNGSASTAKELICVASIQRGHDPQRHANQLPRHPSNPSSPRAHPYFEPSEFLSLLFPNPSLPPVTPPLTSLNPVLLSLPFCGSGCLAGWSSPDLCSWAEALDWWSSEGGVVRPDDWADGGMLGGGGGVLDFSARGRVVER